MTFFSQIFKLQKSNNKNLICLVGLGNFPEKYHQTRHNFGFLFLDFLAKKHPFPAFKFEKKFSGEIARGEIKGQDIILLKPHTYMNLSGDSVQKLCRFFRIKTKNIWIFSDDLDLDFGIVRFRERGSHGGQKGLKDIFQKLDTQEIKRIKFGINNATREKIPTENFVLMKFSPEEQKKLDAILSEGERKLIDSFSI
jgi:PTH1 family peptidyl-tRNA hydrolase